MDVKSALDSYMTSNGSCFMVTWIILKNQLLEVDLTQNWKTTALRNLITNDLLYSIMCEDPTWIKIHWKSIWLRTRSHMTSHYTWGSVTTLHDFESCLRTAFGHFIWALGSCVKLALSKVFREVAFRPRLPHAASGSHEWIASAFVGVKRNGRVSATLESGINNITVASNKQLMNGSTWLITYMISPSSFFVFYSLTLKTYPPSGSLLSKSPVLIESTIIQRTL